MKSAQKAKQPKKVKNVKLPKEANKQKLTKEEKKLVKLTKKDLIKKGKIINKCAGRAIGALAVILCVVSSVLDVLLREKNNNI